MKKKEFLIVADIGEDNPIILAQFILECPYDTEYENERYGYHESVRRFLDDFPWAEEYAVVRYDEDIPYRLIEPYKDVIQEYYESHQIVHWMPNRN